MRKVAIYTRQSIDKKDSISVETQADECKKILSKDELQAVEIYTDKGYSGKDTNRPEIKKLMLELENEKIEKIVVYKLDRISRNITDFYKLYEIMEKHKCKFVSATEGFDTGNSMGKALMGILAVFAQMERENIQKRVRDNYYDRVKKKGSWPGGPAPFGFYNAKTPENSPTLIPNENEMVAVKHLFEHYANDVNVSLNRIGKELFDLGYRSRKRTGGVFDNVTISRILKNPVYVKADETIYNFYKAKGIMVEGDISEWDGTHSCHIVGKKQYSSERANRIYNPLDEQLVYLTNFNGFIDSKTFLKVQNRLSENKQLGRANSNSRLEEFAGKVKCGHCGYALKMYNKDTIDCYGNRSLHICDAHFHHQRGEECADLFLEDIRFEVFGEIQLYYALLYHYYKNEEQVIKSLSEERVALTEQIDILTETLLTLDSPIARKSVSKKLETIGRKITSLDVQINEFNANKTIEIKEKIDIKKLTMEQRKAIINQLVDKILIYDDRKISGDDYNVNMPFKFEIKWKVEIAKEGEHLKSEIYDKMTPIEKMALFFGITEGKIMDVEEYIELENDLNDYIKERNKKNHKTN